MSIRNHLSDHNSEEVSENGENNKEMEDEGGEGYGEIQLSERSDVEPTSVKINLE